MISASDPTVSCMDDMDVLTSSVNAGSAMSFEWWRLFRRNGYLMWGSAKVSEEDYLVCVGRKV